MSEKELREENKSLKDQLSVLKNHIDIIEQTCTIKYDRIIQLELEVSIFPITHHEQFIKM